MDEPIITCPHCATDIKLTESLAAPYIDAKREEFEQKLSSARKTIAAEEAEKAKRALALELETQSTLMTELREALAEKEERLKSAQKEEAIARRKQRELDDAIREQELTIEKRVQSAMGEVRQKAKDELETAHNLRVREKEQQITSMAKQIEELKRKAEQGSQQMQGEVFEIELEAKLQEKFPIDGIEPIGKGEIGGDVLQRVNGSLGQACGTILWELKRTKNWNNGWLAKLRDDQRKAGADVAVLVSHALPKEVKTFDFHEGVWIAAPRFALPLVTALRMSLVEIAGTRQAQDGQQSKMQLVYGYLTGPKFRHRIEAIVEKFSEMKADLDQEKKAMTRIWAKREAQIEGVIDATVGMHGDLQGIAGKAIQEIDSLQLALIETKSHEGSV